MLVGSGGMGGGMMGGMGGGMMGGMGGGMMGGGMMGGGQGGYFQAQSLVELIQEPFTQSIARGLAMLKQIVLVCGRYEGVDERVRSRYVDTEVSIGDYILTGGELPAMVVADAVSRLIPGVLGGARSNREESFEDHFLEYPHYTRPRVFQGLEVPSVLLSGDHRGIQLWRRTQSIKRTLERRPDLLEKACLSETDKCILEELKQKHGKPSHIGDQESDHDQ